MPGFLASTGVWVDGGDPAPVFSSTYRRFQFNSVLVEPPEVFAASVPTFPLGVQDTRNFPKTKPFAYVANLVDPPEVIASTIATLPPYFQDTRPIPAKVSLPPVLSVDPAFQTVGPFLPIALLTQGPPITVKATRATPTNEPYTPQSSGNVITPPFAISAQTPDPVYPRRSQPTPDVFEPLARLIDTPIYMPQMSPQLGLPAAPKRLPNPSEPVVPFVAPFVDFVLFTAALEPQPAPPAAQRRLPSPWPPTSTTLPLTNEAAYRVWDMPAQPITILRKPAPNPESASGTNLWWPTLTTPILMAWNVLPIPTTRRTQPAPPLDTQALTLPIGDFATMTWYVKPSEPVYQRRPPIPGEPAFAAYASWYVTAPPIVPGPYSVIAGQFFVAGAVQGDLRND